MKNLAFIFIFLLSINAFAQTAKWQASQIFEHSQKIAEVTKSRIWNEFEPMKYTSLSPEKVILFSSQGITPNNSFSWSLSDEYFSDNNLENNLSITFHEAFHAFEQDGKRAGKEWRRENSMLIFEYQESSARNNALFNIEGKILNSALQTKNLNQLKEKVRRFLAVRNLRQSEIDPRFIEFEKGAESNEGMAEYAGTKAVELAMQANKKLGLSFNYLTAEIFLAKKYERLDSITKIGKNIRLKFYYTGSAQGFLLDRLMPDWKTKVQIEGKAVQDLLTENVGKNDAKTDKILRRYDYEKILAEEEKSVAKRKADNQTLLENTLKQKGRKYVINYAQLKGWTGIRNFDPMNVTMVTPNVRVHTRMVTFASENSFTANFSQPVIEDLENKQYTTFVTENESVLADGAAVDLGKNGEVMFDKSLTVNSANFKIGASVGIIKILDGEILIVLNGK
jgi:hypothetical protein